MREAINLLQKQKKEGAADVSWPLFWRKKLKIQKNAVATLLLHDFRNVL
jgi:hypothetical protein